MASLCVHSRAEGDFMSDGQVFQCPLTGQTSDFECFFFSYKSTISLLCKINCMPSACCSLKMVTALSSFTF